VGPHLVVVAAKQVELEFGVGQVEEDFGIQALRPQASHEALGVPILPGRSGMKWERLPWLLSQRLK